MFVKTCNVHLQVAAPLFSSPAQGHEVDLTPCITTGQVTLREEQYFFENAERHFRGSEGQSEEESGD